MARSNKPTLAGIFDLVGGGFLSIFAIIILVLGIMTGINTEGNLFPILGILFLPPGLLAIAGSIFALKRRHWLIALICSILAAPTTFYLTTPAIILIALSREEFNTLSTV